MSSGGNKPIEYLAVDAHQATPINAEVIVEMPVSLTVNGEVWLTLMCTPIDLDALAVGFLYNEGIISSNADVASVRVCPTFENIDIWLNFGAKKPTQWRRTSGCTGGVTSLGAENSASFTPAMFGDLQLKPEEVFGMIVQLFESQDLYRRSGGVHTSALSDGRNILVVAEDIGRHNSIDKIAGRCLLQGISPERRILLTTGRISSEMLQKAARLGAAVVISRTSPSSLSIDMAEKWGITLIGYAHRNRFNVYTHPQRICTDSSQLALPSYSQDLEIRS